MENEKLRLALVNLADQADSIGQHLVYNAPTRDFAAAIKDAREVLATPDPEANIVGVVNARRVSPAEVYKILKRNHEGGMLDGDHLSSLSREIAALSIINQYDQETIIVRKLIDQLDRMQENEIRAGGLAWHRESPISRTIEELRYALNIAPRSKTTGE